jgi:hypothetical protein
VTRQTNNTTTKNRHMDAISLGPADLASNRRTSLPSRQLSDNLLSPKIQNRKQGIGRKKKITEKRGPPCLTSSSDSPKCDYSSGRQSVPKDTETFVFKIPRGQRLPTSSISRFSTDLISTELLKRDFFKRWLRPQTVIVPTLLFVSVWDLDQRLRNNFSEVSFLVTSWSPRENHHYFVVRPRILKCLFELTASQHLPLWEWRVLSARASGRWYQSQKGSAWRSPLMLHTARCCVHRQIMVGGGD